MKLGPALPELVRGISVFDCFGSRNIGSVRISNKLNLVLVWLFWFLVRVCESLTREEVVMSLLVYYKHRKLSCDIEPDKIVTTVVLSAAYRLKQITIRKVTMHIKLKAKASYSQFWRLQIRLAKIITVTGKSMRLLKSRSKYQPC